MSIAQAQSAQGYAIFRNISITATGVNVKASRGKLYGLYVANNAAAARFVKFYNDAGTPDENDTPVLTLGFPASSGANILYKGGIEFSAGIALRAVKEVVDNDATAADTNDIVVNLLYL